MILHILSAVLLTGTYHDCLRERAANLSSGVAQASYGAPLTIAGAGGIVGGVVLVATQGKDMMIPGLVSAGIGVLLAGIGAPLSAFGVSATEIAAMTDCVKSTPAPKQPPAAGEIGSR